MARFALINPSNQINRFGPATAPTKTGWKWLPCPNVATPTYDPSSEIVEGPTYTVNATDVTEAWNKRNLTVQELSNAKDAAVNSINGSPYPALLKILLAIANDNRAVKRKINAVIAATGIATPAFPAGQTTSPANDWTDADLKAYIKGML